MTPHDLLHPIQGWRTRREHRPDHLGPDGASEHLFRPLDDSQPRLAQQLRTEFIQLLAGRGELPSSALADLATWVDLRVGPDDVPGRNRLRIASAFTGATRWLPDWDGEPDEAIEFVREVADLEASDIEYDRRLANVTSWRDLYK